MTSQQERSGAAAIMALAVAWMVLNNVASSAATPSSEAQSLWSQVKGVERPHLHFNSVRSLPVRLDDRALSAAIQGEAALELHLFEQRLTVDRDRQIRNPSGSISWVGTIRGNPAGSVVLVTRRGVTLGSIRTGVSLYMLYYVGRDPEGRHLHAIHEVDEKTSMFEEASATPVQLDPTRLEAAERLAERKATGQEPEDDGSIQDLMVVYTPASLALAGSVVAIENMIDLGVTETNLSYEASGVAHRLHLVHTALTDYDENQPGGDPRDRLQDPKDGHMDEVHALRDIYSADLVKLILSTGGCGRAFIMGEVSLAFEAFAFCWTGYVCISPGYSFQHELGHVQGGRHPWGADDTDNAPFTFNHGYYDAEAGFRTIMATNDPNCPDCPRRLLWSNPEVNDPRTGAPTGIPEGEPQAADNRKTLNATAWTVANFRVSTASIFRDGFESGDLSAWSLVEGDGS